MRLLDMADDPSHHNPQAEQAQQSVSNQGNTSYRDSNREPPRQNQNRDALPPTYEDLPPTYEATTSSYQAQQRDPRGPARHQYNPTDQGHIQDTNGRIFHQEGQPDSSRRQLEQQQTFQYQGNITNRSVDQERHSRERHSRHDRQEIGSHDTQQVNGERQSERQQHQDQTSNRHAPGSGRQASQQQRQTSNITQSGSTNIISVSQQDVRRDIQSQGQQNQDHSQGQGHKTVRSRTSQLNMSTVDESLRAIISDIEEVKTELKDELDTRRRLEKTLAETEKEKRDLNNKLASLRVKLGVANANINVGKSEIEQIRTKFQEAQIHKARLEERITTCNADLERMRDPSNPDSNVNMKKLVSNDRKEIRRLRLELESAHEERDETHKQLMDKEMRIKELELMVTQTSEKKERVETDLELAISHKELEYLERQEIEKKYNDLLSEKKIFDEKVSGIRDKIGMTSSGMTDMQRKAEEYRKKEEATRERIEKMDKQLRDVLTEIEQLKSKGRGMPARIAGSIKDHQYRMSKGGTITDTVPESPGRQAAEQAEKSSSVSKSTGGATTVGATGRKGIGGFVPPARGRGVSPRIKPKV